MNEFIVDPSQGAKLVHYVGHFGKIKALKTFTERFGMNINMKDDHG